MTPTGGQEPARTSASRNLEPRQIGAFILGALAVLFAVLNLDDVSVNWIIGTWETPLIVVIVVCLAIGAGIGCVAARRRRV